MGRLGGVRGEGEREEAIMTLLWFLHYLAPRQKKLPAHWHQYCTLAPLFMHTDTRHTTVFLSAGISRDTGKEKGKKK